MQYQTHVTAAGRQLAGLPKGLFRRLGPWQINLICVARRHLDLFPGDISVSPLAYRSCFPIGPVLCSSDIITDSRIVRTVRIRSSEVASWSTACMLNRSSTAMVKQYVASRTLRAYSSIQEWHMTGQLRVDDPRVPGERIPGVCFGTMTTAFS